MDEMRKLEMLETMTGEEDSEVLFTYLEVAKGIVLAKLFPFGTSCECAEVPEKYATTQVEIAVYLLNKRGAEGQTVHAENGVSRHYEDGDIPPTLLRRITPYVGVI